MVKRNTKLKKLIAETGLCEAKVARKIGYNNRQGLNLFTTGQRKPNKITKQRIADGLSKILNRKVYTNEF